MKRLLVLLCSSGFLAVGMASLCATRAFADGYNCYNVPELDPGLLASGAAFFAGSLLLLRDRLRRG